jgi:hypothetical protein
VRGGNSANSVYVTAEQTVAEQSSAVVGRRGEGCEIKRGMIPIRRKHGKFVFVSSPFAPPRTLRRRLSVFRGVKARGERASLCSRTINRAGKLKRARTRLANIAAVFVETIAALTSGSFISFRSLALGSSTISIANKVKRTGIKSR